MELIEKIQSDMALVERYELKLQDASSSYKIVKKGNFSLFSF
jgi:hypothetical protein